MKNLFLLALLFCMHANAQSQVAAINHKLPLNDCVHPAYPTTSKSRNEQGEVELNFIVAGNGVATEVTVKKSSGFVDLDNAAITAIRFCKFKVSELISESGSLSSSGKFNFRLEDNKPKENKHATVYKPANKISCDVIKYPALARAFNKEGKTTVSFIVAVDGTTHNPEIKVSSGSDLLDYASKENIEKCKYAPATLNGLPIESVMQQIFNWRFAKTAKTIEPPFLNLHPQVKVCKNIEYPSASWRLEEEGTARIKVHLSKDGEVLKSELLKSTGYRRLDEAAKALLSNQCQFEKLNIGNELIAFSIVFDYTWDMEKENRLKFVSLDI
jgi:TonB family protein